MNPMDVLDVHLSVLGGWFVQTLGKALFVGVLVAAVIGGIGWTTDSGVMLLIGAALGALTAAVILMTADAPLPPE